MSVSQVKKHIEGLEDYLALDDSCLERLRKLKESFNVVRNELASLREQTDRSVSAAAVATDRAIKAESELELAKIEINRLKQVSENLSRELTAATAVHKESEGIDQPDESGDHDEMVAMTDVIKRLRKRMKYCPRCVSVSSEAQGSFFTFNREDLSQGWSREAIWTLGAVVALMTKFAGKTVIETEGDLLRDIRGGKGEKEYNAFDKNFIHWLSRNNMENSLERDVRAGFVNLKNVKEGHLRQIQNEIDEELKNIARSMVGGR